MLCGDAGGGSARREKGNALALITKAEPVMSAVVAINNFFIFLAFTVIIE